MGNIRPVEPAALVMGILHGEPDLSGAVLELLAERFGPLEMQSERFDFTMTDYYTAEMGGNLRKFFCCFRDPILPDALPSVKLAAGEIELRFADVSGGSPKRRINIDPGYVTPAKLVLASTKDYSHRIYIGSGIYGETTLRCVAGTLVPHDTTYPDHATALALDFFNRVRQFAKRNRRLWIPQNG